MKLDCQDRCRAQARRQDRCHRVRHDSLPGFGFRLRLASGGKVLRSWVVQYKRAGSTRRITIGSAEVLGAEAARTAAKKLLAKVALGEDPQAVRVDRRGKDLLTMRSQAGEYLAAKEHELAKRTLIEMRRYLTDARYFGPLHKLAIDTITRRDVAARVVVIMRECGNATAARARGALGSFFTWACAWGCAKATPPSAASLRSRTVGATGCCRIAELAAIWRACRDDDFGRIIRLLALGAWRRAEIGDMAFSELDDPERPTTFTVPAVEAKTAGPTRCQ